LLSVKSILVGNIMDAGRLSVNSVQRPSAGIDQVDKEKRILVKGSSGISVRTLVNLALSLAQEPLPA
jgi:hypothetical protein